MPDIPHVYYSGDSKPIIRLCGAVNALIDHGGGGDIAPAVIAEIQSQIAAVREAISALPYTIAASVENNVLILNGAGASVRGNHLVLASGDVSVSADVLRFD